MSKRLPTPKPDQPDVLDCNQFDVRHQYNALRIKALQEFVFTIIQERKGRPSTPQMTEQLAVLERIRRRITWPLISIKLNPTQVTKILQEEIVKIHDLLRFENPDFVKNQDVADQLNRDITTKLEKPEYWKCPPRPAVAPPEPPGVPPVIEEKSIEGKSQTIIFDQD